MSSTPTNETGSGGAVQRTIARNTLWNVAGRAWDAISALILTPYIVWRVGLGDYGVWGLVGAFTGYVGLLDLGLGSGYAKFVAEHAARNEPRRISQIVTTAISFYAVLGVVLAVVGLPFVGSVASFFAQYVGISVEGSGDLVFLAQGALVLFLIGNCIAPLSAIQPGLQRMDLSNAVGFAMSLIKVVTTIALLEGGFGLRGLLYSNAVVLVAFGLTSAAIAFRLLPTLRIGPGLISRSAFNSLFSFGWRAQVARLSNLITFETDIVIIGLLYRAMPLAGAYKVGVELSNKVRQVPVMLLGAIIPAASDLDTRDDRDRLQRLYIIGSKYIAAVAIPLALFSAASGGALMRAWMGEPMPEAAWVFRIIVIGYLANVLQGPGISVALGMGQPGLQMHTGLIAMISNVALTIFLALTWGYIGVAIATAASMYLSMAWFLVAMRRLTQVPARAVWSNAIRWPLLASIVPCTICAICEIALYDLNGRLPSIALVLALAAIFGSAYLITLRFMPFLDAFDVHFLQHTLRLRRVPFFAALMRRAAGRTSA